ncbi:hypothetical protein DL93DRAFT_2070597 [Clavulina sp. PMI_390]|nr:hypothetical protein DL93DRAFT_2070597 [Clavulina sp. PMI_390]
MAGRCETGISTATFGSAPMMRSDPQSSYHETHHTHTGLKRTTSSLSIPPYPHYSSSPSSSSSAYYTSEQSMNMNTVDLNNWSSSSMQSSRSRPVPLSGEKRVYHASSGSYEYYENDDYDESPAFHQRATLATRHPKHSRSDESFASTASSSVSAFSDDSDDACSGDDDKSSFTSVSPSPSNESLSSLSTSPRTRHSHHKSPSAKRAFFLPSAPPSYDEDDEEEYQVDVQACAHSISSHHHHQHQHHPHTLRRIHLVDLRKSRAHFSIPSGGKTSRATARSDENDDALLIQERRRGALFPLNTQDEKQLLHHLAEPNSSVSRVAPEDFAHLMGLNVIGADNISAAPTIRERRWSTIEKEKWKAESSPSNSTRVHASVLGEGEEHPLSLLASNTLPALIEPVSTHGKMNEMERRARSSSVSSVASTASSNWSTATTRAVPRASPRTSSSSSLAVPHTRSRLPIPSFLHRPSAASVAASSSSEEEEQNIPTITHEEEMTTHLITRTPFLSCPSSSSSRTFQAFPLALPLLTTPRPSKALLRSLCPTRFSLSWQALRRTPAQRAVLAPRGAARARMGSAGIKEGSEKMRTRSNSPAVDWFSASADVGSFLPGPDNFLDLDDDEEDETTTGQCDAWMGGEEDGDDEDEDEDDVDEDEYEYDSEEEDELNDVFSSYRPRPHQKTSKPKPSPNHMAYHRSRVADHPLFYLSYAVEHLTAQKRRLVPPSYSGSSHHHHFSPSSPYYGLEARVPWRTEHHHALLLSSKRKYGQGEGGCGYDREYERDMDWSVGCGDGAEIWRAGKERLCERGRWVVLGELGQKQQPEDEKKRIRVGSTLRNVCFVAEP